ncbi:sn-glycerol-3-phosphate ABC transporter ATP-binding protein UgpC [Labrenzia sp. DG1229]|uniref:ABC transporter ATP-binding protein n=1 Tax=Labrenzia sp. DG1229 TaxID=681847 RepID=UPI00048D42F8|nr:sn-glycerol-3-phosphate ABC transporter ATP-binding protein UgpC [Labrenzia sp. DG1229]
MASLDLRHVGKAFGAAHVLHDVGIEICDGEFVVLVGPSGCGKSTLLRVIAGLEDATSGQVLIDGIEVNDVHPKDRDIAMVFQNYGLYPHMTAAQNMGFALKLQGKAKDEIQSKIETAAQILGLTPLLGRYPRQLSGGQRQRVAMGRAIVRDPKLFLFDEPLSNLDAKLRVQMRTEIRSLHQKLKATTVYVTHDQIEAMTMADKIVAMSNGDVMQIGSPLELYDRPANTFVASFIGSPAMNLLKVTRGEDKLVLSSGQSLSIKTPTLKNTSSELMLGIRPEDFVLGDTGIELSVETVEHTGAETYVQAPLGEDTVTVLLRERSAISPGQTIHVAPRGGHIHLFDQVTGNRLN